MTSNTPLNFGIIGLGAGAMNMIPELRANPNARIVAVADPRDSPRAGGSSATSAAAPTTMRRGCAPTPAWTWST